MSETNEFPSVSSSPTVTADGGFHAKDNWYFRRLEDGSVEMRNETGRAITNRVAFEASMWASICASVTPDGETSDTYFTALAFHNSEVVRGDDKVECYRRSDRKWDWRRSDPQGRVLVNTSQGYENFGDCWKMAVDLNPSVKASNFSVSDPPVRGE